MSFGNYMEVYIAMAALITLLAERVYNWIKNKKKQNPASLIESVHFDLKLDPILWNQLIDYNAVRSFILQFHNGEFYYSKQHIQKVSCSHERVRRGVKKIKDSVSDLTIPDSIREINKMFVMEDKTFVYFPNIDEPHEDFKQDKYDMIAEKLRSFDAKSAIYFILCNSKGQPIGLHGLHFYHRSPLNQGQINTLINEKNQIEYLFNHYKHD